MQLVPEEIHVATGHTGGAALLRSGGAAGDIAEDASSVTGAQATKGSAWSVVANFVKDIATDPTTYMGPGLGTFLSIMRSSPAK